MTATGWTDAQKKAYVIADNKLALNAGWDNAMLAIEMTDLSNMGFDLELTGFDLGELADLFDVDAEEKEELTKNVEVPQNQMLLTFETEFLLQEWYERAQNEGIECKLL